MFATESQLIHVIILFTMMTVVVLTWRYRVKPNPSLSNNLLVYGATMITAGVFVVSNIGTAHIRLLIAIMAVAAVGVISYYAFGLQRSADQSMAIIVIAAGCVIGFLTRIIFQSMSMSWRGTLLASIIALAVFLATCYYLPRNPERFKESKLLLSSDPQAS